MSQEEIVAHIEARINALENASRGGFQMKIVVISAEVSALSTLLKEIKCNQITDNTAIHAAFAMAHSWDVNQHCSR